MRVCLSAEMPVLSAQQGRICICMNQNQKLIDEIFFMFLLAAAAPPIASSDEEQLWSPKIHALKFNKSLVRANWRLQCLCRKLAALESRRSAMPPFKQEVGNFFFFSRYRLEVCWPPQSSPGCSMHLRRLPRAIKRGDRVSTGTRNNIQA